MPMIRFGALAVLLPLFAPDAAHAQAAASCSVASTPMSFGGYNGSSALPTVSTATISVTCLALDRPTIVNVNIALTGGRGARQLSLGADRLNMEIYTDANRSIIFGDGTGGSTLLSGSGTASQVTPLRMNFTVYGRVQARQRLPRSGSYMDALTVLMTY
jgi:spore coat protein U-like protein